MEVREGISGKVEVREGHDHASGFYCCTVTPPPLICSHLCVQACGIQPEGSRGCACKGRLGSRGCAFEGRLGSRGVPLKVGWGAGGVPVKLGWGAGGLPLQYVCMCVCVCV